MHDAPQKDQYLRWTAAMRRGEFEKAWNISDKVLESGTPEATHQMPRHLRRVWNGEPLAGKHVLVRCNHGLGDTIQIARFLPLLCRIARRVDVAVQQPLIPLVESMGCVDHVGPDISGSADKRVEIEIMELAHAFRINFDTIPRHVPYFRVESKTAKDHGYRVGLVWQAGDWDARRSVPFDLMEPLFGIDGLRIKIFQKNAENAGWRAGCGELACGKGLIDDAESIASLDLMISVDTMTAHLAGALAVPVWTLLHSDADWRWLEGRNDSPWYPTMRLFRQERAGDWSGVVQKITSELLQLFPSN